MGLISATHSTLRGQSRKRSARAASQRGMVNSRARAARPPLVHISIRTNLMTTRNTLMRVGNAFFATCATNGSTTQVQKGNVAVQSMVPNIATTPTDARRHWSEGWQELRKLEDGVHKIGICSLRGNTLQPDVYRPLLQKAFAQKIIGQDQYKRMMYTLRYGADLFIDQDALALLPDRIFRRNYPSAYENSASKITL